MKWRLFRQDAGRVSGLPPWAYVLLFSMSMALGQWSVARYGGVVIWPANGVILAALLQLHRRQAISVLVTCFLINIGSNVMRGDPGILMWANAVLNFGETLLAGLIARRFCGAALDMRSPTRLARFALLAAVPAVALSAAIGVEISEALPERRLSAMVDYFSMEVLGLLIVTPTLLLVRRQRFSDLRRVPFRETTALFSLLAAVTVTAFSQSSTAALFLVFPPLLLIAFRLSPSWAAFSVLLVATIGAGATLTGYGPIAPPADIGEAAAGSANNVLRALPSFYLFMAAVLCVALPASTAVTERRRLEARLKTRTVTAQHARQAAEQADAAKSRFLAMMSHEMRTPLNTITGFASLLTTRPDLDPVVTQQVGHIRDAGDGLLVMVDDILDFSRGGVDLNLAPLSVSDVVHEAVDRERGAADAKGLALAIQDRLDPSLRHVGDARRLRQVLRHLLSNAIKFTASGGVEVILEAEVGGIFVSVTDTGPGVESEMLGTLFDPFYQIDASISRTHAGAGMGLALCRQLIEAMGGRIEIDSRAGVGSTFWFRVPLPFHGADSPGQACSNNEADPEYPPCILVVDDHAINRQVASLILTAAGCRVVQAADGMEAVDVARVERLDLILMDVRMPRMDGLAATRAIRAIVGPAGRVPIIAVTADAMPEDVDRCLAAGMDGHLAKPVTEERLIETVRTRLQSARTRTAA
ncbi:ATP-binding protein [uncultured Brevundimonas sp.]|uniref:hybrid sensor histidine kinase/response regulator n=1 Tax=uncultured Brevundimonas sp. TaxID=213418 RepID=UPI0030EBBB6F